MNARTSLARIGFSFALVLAVFGLSPSARADSAPATRAARLTFVQGTVTVQSADNSENVPAQLNLPLITGVQVVTGGDGQAEVEFEDGSVVRLTPNSALSLSNLAIQPDGVFFTNLSLLHGLAYCELRATPQYRYMLDAGGDVLSPVENTTVRVNFDEPPAIFSVLDGTAEVERQSAPNTEAPSSGYQTQVRAGESLRADPADGNRYFLTQQIAEDSWDQWNDDLDQTAAAEAASSTAVRNDYAGAQGYGWSDLDADGDWYNVPGQGPVWQPNAAVDDSSFDPYGNGAWVSYPGTGYLWASGYGWGWTPYRCGNWSFYGGFGWGWAPGAACGGFGWGFFGGGRPVNIVVGPTGYRPIRVPIGVGRPIHPILPVRTTSPTVVRSEPVQRGPRQIAGVTATPIKPVGNGLFPGGGTAGSSLRRDFPVDSASHVPVMGLASTSPTVVHTTAGFRSMPAAPASAGAPARPSPFYSAPTYPASEQARPAQGVRPTPYTPPTLPRPPQPFQRSLLPQPSRPSYTPAPPRPMSAPAPSHPAPAPAPSHPK